MSSFRNFPKLDRGFENWIVPPKTGRLALGPVLNNCSNYLIGCHLGKLLSSKRKFIYKSLNGLSSDLKFFSFETKRNTHSNDNKFLQISAAKLNYTQNCIFHIGVKLWNNIDLKIREIKWYQLFIRAIQNFFIN